MKVAFGILSFLESILLHQMERVLRTRPGGVVGKLMAKPDPAHCVFLAKKNEQHEEDSRYHFGSNFPVSQNQIR